MGVFSATSFQALGKNKRLRQFAGAAVEGDGRYAIVPVLAVRDPGKGWPADEEGLELMNTLAAEGWRVVGALASCVVMERPQSAAGN
jgi:hypothetical protein